MRQARTVHLLGLVLALTLGVGLSRVGARVADAQIIGPKTSLTAGCNSVIVTTTAGTPIANIAALVSPASAVVSIWSFNNGTKQFRAGFFSDRAAPVDFSVTGGTTATQQGSTTVAGTGGLAQITNSSVAAGAQVTEDYFVCVSQAATINAG